MTAKEYLASAAHIPKNISYRLEQVKVLENMQAIIADSVFAEPGATGHADANASLERRAEIAGDIQRLYALEKNVFAVIDQLDNPTHRMLLTLRYVEGKRWAEISKQMHYSTRHLTRVHNQALQALTSIYENGESVWTI